MEQLAMKRRKGNLTVRELPEGFEYENYCGKEEQISDWLKICRHGLINEESGKECFEEAILKHEWIIPEKDLFFVKDRNKKRVATITGIAFKEPNVGYIHMVAADPSVSRMGIGPAMLYHAMKYLEERGVDGYFLTTDDFRLPAIKIYLDAGFEPDYNSPDNTPERWNKVFDSLKKR